MSTLVCPNCNYQTDNDERFCWKCGTQLVAVRQTIYCSFCGAALKPYAEFCSQCGARRKSSGESACGRCGAEVKPGEQYCWKCGTRTGGISGASTEPQLETLYLKGLDDYENKRYVQAVAALKPAAEQGHPKAQFYLAKCYRNGSGVPMNEDEGVRWANRAKEQGIDEDNIDGSREDLVKKARRGDVYAQYQIGRRIANHYFTSKLLYKEDRKWLSRAAGKGYAPAQYLLAACYICISDQKDYSGNRRKLKEKAFEFYREAAEHGHAGALFALGRCYETGDGVAKNRKRAFGLYRRAVEEGYREPLSLFTIGLCYDKGIGTARNKTKALAMYQKAIEFGDELLAPEYKRKLELRVNGVSSDRD